MQQILTQRHFKTSFGRGVRHILFKADAQGTTVTNRDVYTTGQQRCITNGQAGCLAVKRCMKVRLLQRFLLFELCQRIAVGAVVTGTLSLIGHQIGSDLQHMRKQVPDHATR